MDNERNTERSDYFIMMEDMCQLNRLPLHMRNLLTNLNENEIKLPAELLTAIVYYTFLECGFVPASLPTESRVRIKTHWGFTFTAQIPEYSWQIVANEIAREFRRTQQNEASSSNQTSSEPVYEFQLNLLKHSDADMQLIIRKIFGGSALCINFCYNQDASSIILFVNNSINLPTDGNIDDIYQNPKQYFKNMKNLIDNLRKNLIIPIRNIVMYESAYPNAALHGMPEDVLGPLFYYLKNDLETLQMVSQTCVYLRNMAIAYLHKKQIQLRQRRPTPIVYDSNDQNNYRARYRIFNDPGLFFGGYHPLIYVPNQ